MKRYSECGRENGECNYLCIMIFVLVVVLDISWIMMIKTEYGNEGSIHCGIKFHCRTDLILSNDALLHQGSACCV